VAAQHGEWAANAASREDLTTAETWSRSDILVAMRGRELAGLLIVLCAAAGSACGDTSGTSLEPPAEGEELYLLTPGLCGGDCKVWTLYREAELVELRAHGDAYLGRAGGELSHDTAAQLDAQLAALDEAYLAGEIDLSHASCQLSDAPGIRLFLPSDTLDYGEGCEPEAVLELDGLLRSLVEDLAHCQASERVTPAPECEPLI
jgi:hypothetical protein